MPELEFLQAIQSCEDVDCLPILRDHFEQRGPRGSHLCFVMDLLSTDVSSFRRSFPTRALPPFFVKNIISLVLQGVDQIHELNIVHTGGSVVTGIHLVWISYPSVQTLSRTTFFLEGSLTHKLINCFRRRTS
jgi:hypothetical protein